MFPDTDFSKLAQDIGGFGIRVRHPNEMQGAIDQAVASGKQTGRWTVRARIDTPKAGPWSAAVPFHLVLVDP